jgi:hypothetical protein
MMRLRNTVCADKDWDLKEGTKLIRMHWILIWLHIFHTSGEVDARYPVGWLDRYQCCKAASFLSGSGSGFNHGCGSGPSSIIYT